MKRSSGILMPLYALPSPYGIGTLGKAARDYVDFLSQAGQSWWQMLPVGPTSYGDSPYQSPSTYAGNPYYIDLDRLVADRLLTRAEIDALAWGDDPERVDYGKLYENRFTLLQKATDRGWERDADQVAAFVKENAGWLPDYALFMALKRHFGMACWLDWPEAIRLRKPAAVARYREALAQDIRLFTYIQYLFFTQWADLRDYAHKKGVGILGDLPIYVALDSVDVWASPESFQLDEKGFPTAVAGVPPDYFSEDGQLWGNPLYDYETMARDGYAWWIRRVDGAAKLYDVIRIDHFRGFDTYWSVPYGAKTAKSGHWVKGPGMALVGVLRDWFSNIRFIAEDLGEPSPDVVKLLKESGFPGMKVLEFAFDAKESSDYLPHTYPQNCVCYGGTHDNETLLGWLEGADPADRQKAVDYLGLNQQEGYVWGLIRGGMSSVADLFVTQMQDYLELDNTARTNTPGLAEGNWQWRMAADALTPALAKKIAKLTKLYDR
ncbi:MAG: 4-alpha-glucanotransferase [Ruminococcaceae bacterium]|nr:4-alpha-glucanotransferase [Oscillospiraceae bacterium]